MRRALTNSKRIVAVLVIFCLMFSLIPANTFAVAASDISGHWAQVTIQSWMNKGLIKGYPDGTFKPDQNVTRAEFMTLANRAFGYTTVVPITYTDVKAGSWYAPEVAKAKAAGYISGYPDGTMRPENPITREEVATIAARIKNLTSDANAAGKYTDAAKIGSWSKGQVGAVTSAKIMQGYPDGSFKPQRLMTRAEVVVASNNTLYYIPPVANIAVSAITVTPTTMVLTAGGATGAITATVSPSNATNKIVTWSSSNAAVATIAGGVVTPVAAGTAVITATTAQGSFTATCTVTVTAPVVSPAPAPTTYTVTFDSQGGTAVTAITGIAYGATVTLPTAPTKAGFTFASWNTAVAGTGTAFTAATVVTANVTVYAQWTAVVGDITAPTAPSTPTAAAGPNISAAEKTAGVAVVVGLGTSGAVAGDTLDLLVGGVAFATTPQTHVLTAGEITAGTYTFTVPTGAGAGWGDDGSKVLTATVTDAALNVGAASAALTLALDTAAPTAAVTYSKGSVKSGDTLTITATFSEALLATPVVQIGVTYTGGITALAATTMTKTSTTVYYYALNVPAGDGTGTVSFSVGTDAAGNVVVAAPTGGATFIVDNTAPTVTIGSNKTSLKKGDTATITFTLSETSTNFAVGDDVWAGPGTLSAWAGSGTSYTATFTPTAGGIGTATLGVEGGTFTDAAGNANTAATQVSMPFDTLAPTASLAYTIGGTAVTRVKSGNIVLITATFSEPLADDPVVQLARTVTDAAAAAIMTKGTSTSYTYSWTVGTGNGAMTAVMSVGKDLAGNVITAAPTSGASTVTVDNIAPIVTITNLGSTTLGTAEHNDRVVFVFTEAVGLDWTKIGGGTMTTDHVEETEITGTIDGTAKTLTIPGLGVFTAATSYSAGTLTLSLIRESATELDVRVDVVVSGGVCVGDATFVQTTGKLVDLAGNPLGTITQLGGVIF